MHFQRVSAFLFFWQSINASFSPCPILGPNFPRPTSIASASIVRDGTNQLQSYLDQAMKTGQLGDNSFTTNTTTFSIALFTTSEVSQQEPFFWQYHYTAPDLMNGNTTGTKQVDANSVYRLGSLTQLFTVWTLLANKGERCLDQPVTDFLPELEEAAEECSSITDPLNCVDWCQVTLRDLGSHLSGIARNYGVSDLDTLNLPIQQSDNSTRALCGAGRACNRSQFLEGIARRGPVYAPGTTPTLSDAAFQILGYAIENVTGKSFAETISDSIISPLNTQSLGLNKPDDESHAVLPESPMWATELGDGGSSFGLYSNIRDLAAAGQAMMSSKFLTPAQTRRWLKPTTLTSNIANSNGMPWEIYAGTSNSNATVTEIYTYLGTLGAYSSYLGLVPNYNVGFAVLAVDSTNVAPDLNAHVDLIDTAVAPALEKLATTQALKNHAGTYFDSASGARLTIAANYTPTALNVLSFTGGNGTDFRALIANLTGVEGGADALSFRLFPTNLETENVRSFRAVYQDVNAPADAGTATCISWMYIDQLVYEGQALDYFVFNYQNGAAVSLEVPGFGLKLVRKSA